MRAQMWGGGAVVVVVGVVLCWALWPQAESSAGTTDGSPARPVLPSEAAERAPPAADHAEPEPVTLVVRPGDHTMRVLMPNGSVGTGGVVMMVAKALSDAWQLLEGVVVPELGVQLQQTHGAAARASLAASLDPAEWPGGPDVLEDPGEAFVALEVLRLLAEQEQRVALEAFNHRHGLPSMDERQAYWAARRALDEEAPRVRSDEALAFADQLAERYAGTDVADVVALYQADWYGDRATDAFDEATHDAVLLDVVLDAEIPELVDLAVNALGATHRPLGAADYDRAALDATYETLRSEVAQQALAETMLLTALEDEDPSAVRWFARYQDTTARQMAAAEDQPWVADGLRAKLDHYGGLVVATGAREPTTWQEGLVAAVHRCGAGPRDAQYVGDGQWDGSWSWTWSGSDPLVYCVSGAVPGGPVPPDGQRVKLVVPR